MNEGSVRQIVTLNLPGNAARLAMRDDKMRTMSLKISPSPVPLTTDEGGVVRVGATRVRLDTVVYAFNQVRRPKNYFSNIPR